MGTKYHKIQSLYKRDPETKKFIAEYSKPEFQYLYHSEWEGYEKVDGTNIRITWDMPGEYPQVTIEGRGDNSQIPTGLFTMLQKKFTEEVLLEVCGRPEAPVVIYGEGVGPKIQPPGTRNSKDFDFILFDVRIGRWWLKQDAVTDFSKSKLNLKRAPQLYEGTLCGAEICVREGFTSQISEDPDLPAEGLILRPKVELFARNGDRIIVKLKTKDYQK